MTDRITLSPQLPELTSELFTSATGIIGLRGSGKTSNGVVIVEQAIARGVPTVVVDPTGVWYGLKSSSDGKSPGLPVYVFGGVHADVPLEPTAGALLARFIVDNPVPMILDLSDFSKDQQRRFVTEFMVKLYDLKARQRSALLVVLDEAPRFVPQGMMRGDLELAKCVGAVEDIATLGRSRGLGIVLIGQRAATINKNVLTQVDNLIAMRLTGPSDRKAINEWISEKAEDAQRERDELVQNLPALKNGEGYFWSPSLFEVFRRVRFAARTTFDSSRTPKIGEKIAAPTAFAKVDLEALNAEIAATVEKQKADDPKALRARIAELESQLSRKPEIETVTIEVEKPILRAEDLAVLRSAAEDARDAATALQSAANRIEEAVTAALAEVPSKPLERAVRSSAEAERSGSPRSIHSERESTRSRPAEGSSEPGSLPRGERVVLIAIAQHPAGVTREQLTVLTGYKRSTRDLYLQHLKAAGFIAAAGSTISATMSGVAELGSDFVPLPTGKALRDHWFAQLPEGEGRIFKVLVDCYPRVVDRDTISRETGYKRSTRDLYLQLLRRRKLVVAEAGALKASDDLFPTGKPR